MVRDKPSAKPWGTTRKKAAREDVLSTFREVTGLQVLPEPLEYWTLGGQCARGGVLDRGCEYDHLINDLGFILPRQWVSVERSVARHAENESASLPGKWMTGDFLKLLASRIYADSPARPGFIHFDTQYAYSSAICSGRISDLLRVASHPSNPVFVACNLVLNFRPFRSGFDPSDVGLAMLADGKVQRAIANGGWSATNECYVYDGRDSESHTDMIYLYFHRGWGGRAL